MDALDIAACPACGSAVHASNEHVACAGCGDRYPLRHGRPVLVAPDSELYAALVEGRREGMGAMLKDQPRRRLADRIAPEDRIWSHESLRMMRHVIDSAEGPIINIGAAENERQLKRALTGRDVIRVGFPTHGTVDIYGDAHRLPIASNSAGLLISSSVMEHLSQPDTAVAESHRVLRRGGHVYAEIPFMRPYHLIPADYQRYTLSGIQRLFERHGFNTVRAGVCSGPFCALALFAQDWLINPYTSRFIGWGLRGALVKRLLHPIKYLDRLVERTAWGRKWSAVCACNFYYVGRKPFDPMEVPSGQPDRDGRTSRTIAGG